MKIGDIVWSTMKNIDTAPKDGTVILTNEGFVKYIGNGISEYNYWACCRPDGEVFSCAKEGHWAAYPTKWVEIGN